jgi:hypothetical protein
MRRILDFFEPREIVTVECRDGQSRFERLEPEKLTDWLDDYSIGELWQRNVVDMGKGDKSNFSLNWTYPLFRSIRLSDPAGPPG